MTVPNGTTKLAQKATIIATAIVSCAAAMAILWSAVQWTSGMAWAHATRPIMAEIEANRVELLAQLSEESAARRLADSLMVNQIANIGKAWQAPAGSNRERDALRDVTAAPKAFQKQEPGRP